MEQINKIIKSPVFWIVILVILLGIGGFLYYRNKKKKGRAKQQKNDTAGQPKGNPADDLDYLFSDPSTYVENAKKYPRKWKQWVGKIAKEAKDIGASVIKDDGLKASWYNIIYMEVKPILDKNKPEKTFLAWQSGDSPSPLAELVGGGVWMWGDEYKKGNWTTIISRKEAEQMLEKAGADPHVNWILNFPEEADTEDEKKN